MPIEYSKWNKNTIERTKIVQNWNGKCRTFIDEKIQFDWSKALFISNQSVNQNPTHTHTRIVREGNESDTNEEMIYSPDDVESETDSGDWDLAGGFFFVEELFVHAALFRDDFAFRDEFGRLAFEPKSESRRLSARALIEPDWAPLNPPVVDVRLGLFNAVSLILRCDGWRRWNGAALRNSFE